LVPLLSKGQVEYLVNVSLGTPRQNGFQLLLDTGSSWIIVTAEREPFTDLQVLVFWMAAGAVVLIAIGAIIACRTYRHKRQAGNVAYSRVPAKENWQQLRLDSMDEEEEQADQELV